MKIIQMILFVVLSGMTPLSAMQPTPLADELGRTPLHEAAFKGDELLLVLELFRYNTPHETVEYINQKDLLGRTALHYAAKVGFFNGVRALLALGADPNATDAARAVYDEIYKERNRKGRDRPNPPSIGYTPLDFAAMQGDEQIVRELIANKAIAATTLAQAFHKTLRERTGLAVAGTNEFERWDALDTVCYLILQRQQWQRPTYDKEYLDAYTSYLSGETANTAKQCVDLYPVHDAVIDNDLERCEALVNAGHACDELDDRKHTPLVYAAIQHQCACAELLLKAGARKQIDQALWVAGYLFGTSQMLVERIPHVLATKKQLFELLLAYGANINSYVDDKSKYTLLHQAVVDNEADAVSALIQYGADTRVVDAQGRTPRDLALELNHEEAGLVFIKRKSSTPPVPKMSDAKHN